MDLISCVPVNGVHLLSMKERVIKNRPDYGSLQGLVYHSFWE